MIMGRDFSLRVTERERLSVALAEFVNPPPVYPTFRLIYYLVVSKIIKLEPLDEHNATGDLGSKYLRFRLASRCCTVHLGTVLKQKNLCSSDDTVFAVDVPLIQTRLNL